MEKKKIILDLCGGTGAWSAPYKKAGYEVILITLPDYDVTNVVLGDTIVFFHKKEGSISVPVKDVHGILAAPPCTQFSIARTKAIKPRDLEEGMRVVRACLEIIWHCRSKGDLQWWALENPTGLLRQFLGKPTMRFEQWQFGDDGIKPTDIWGYYNVPRKTHAARGLFVRSKDEKKIYSRFGHRKAAEIFATTPPGFARSFYKSNK